MSLNLEQCPLCNSELSQTKFREIRTKLRDQEERKASELAEAKAAIAKSLEEEFNRRFELQKEVSEKKFRDAADKLVTKAVAENAQLALKLKDAQARQAVIRKEAEVEIGKQKQAAEKKARAEADQQMKSLTAERDNATELLAAAKPWEVEILKHAEQEAERLRRKELMDQRQALEKDKSLALIRQQSAHNRDRDSMQKKLKLLEHQLQNRLRMNWATE